MRPSRPRSVLPLTLLLAGSALALAGAPPAVAATRPYVALGDSFAAGVGARTYDEESAGCHRSPKGYPALVAARARLRLTFAACAGAATGDVLERQVRLLRPSTRYVTLTVGGNDLGFESVLTTCARPGWLGGCGKAVDRARRTLRTALPGRLDRVLAAVRARAPRARVVVTGYPRLFDGDDCSAATFFSRKEMRRLNAAADELDATLRARTRAAGMRYVDPLPTFGGHAWCDDDAWINGPSKPFVNSFHPDVDGHAAYSRLVGPALLGRRWSTAGAAAAPVSLPTAVGPVGHPAVRPPDLEAPAFVRASLAAGVTRAELTQLARAQQTGAPADVLDRLDAELTRRAAARLERRSRAVSPDAAAPPTRPRSR